MTTSTYDTSINEIFGMSTTPRDTSSDITNAQIARCVVRTTAAALSPVTAKRLRTFGLDTGTALAALAIVDHNYAYPLDPIVENSDNRDWLADALTNYAIEFAFGREDAKLIGADCDSGKLVWRRADGSRTVVVDEICFERPTAIAYTFGDRAIYRACNLDCYLESAWSTTLPDPEVPWFECDDAVEDARVPRNAD